MSTWWESLSILQQCFALAALPATLLLAIQTVLLLFGLVGGGDEGSDGHDMEEHHFDGHHLSGHHVDTSQMGGHDSDTGFDMDDGGYIPEGEYTLDNLNISEHDFPDDHHEAGVQSDDGLRIFTVRAFIAFFAIFGWMGIALAETNIHIVWNIVISTIAGFAAMVVMASFFKMALKLQQSGNLDMRNSLGKTGTVYLPIPPRRTGKGKVTMIVQGRFMEVEAVTDYEESLKTGMEVVGVSISNQNVLCVVPKNNE